MKCEICGMYDAVIFVQQIKKNESKSFHLCINCARERGIGSIDENSEIGLSLNNLLSEIKELKSSLELHSPTCPICGETLYTIKNEKRAGCPECYTVFKSEIIELMKQKNCHPNYTGSLPKKLPSFRSVLTDRMLFHKKMEQAVADENYEQAAIYRDRLKMLETKALDGDYTNREDTDE